MVHIFKEWVGKEGNMAVHTYVKLENKSITCLHDPAYMRIHDHVDEKHEDKHLVWHLDEGEEFELRFDESPFENGQLKVTGKKKIKEKVKDHDSRVEYKYGITITTSTGQQISVDPGLIIDP